METYGEVWRGTETQKEWVVPHSHVVDKNWEGVLACVAQWTEFQPGNQKVAGWIPGWGTCLGCGPGPHLGEHERQPHMGVSLPLFLPPFPSL